jgi:peptidoglycan/xylan/chitin deacetylase (PgdA/CDA1 family)
VSQLTSELDKVEQAFIKILGLRPLWFRPPYGAYNDRSLKVLSERGYTNLALWSDDSGDSLGESVQYQKDALDAAAGQYDAPRMTLQHSTSANGG